MGKLISVTIGRNFGSKGREIGEKLAAELKFEFYDKNLILMAAQQSGMSFDLLDQADEKLINRFLDPYAELNSIQGNTNDRLFHTQRDIIRKIAATQNCVIVGRMADLALKDDPDCIRVFIYAPLEKRIETISKKYNLKDSQAKKLIKQMDKERASHYRYFSLDTWDNKDEKNIMIDSSLLGIDGTVEVLKKIVELKMQGQ